MKQNAKQEVHNWISIALMILGFSLVLTILLFVIVRNIEKKQDEKQEQADIHAASICRAINQSLELMEQEGIDISGIRIDGVQNASEWMAASENPTEPDEILRHYVDIYAPSAFENTDTFRCVFTDGACSAVAVQADDYYGTYPTPTYAKLTRKEAEFASLDKALEYAQSEQNKDHIIFNVAE